MADAIETALLASIRNDAQELGTIPWSLLAQETETDASLGHILHLIEQGSSSFDSNDPVLTNLWPTCESFYVHEGVLLYQDRVVVPTSLRSRVLQYLHAAHQGTSTMEQRARAIVYWPGMSKDIRDTRERCTDCNRNAPSQAATPPLPSPPPSTPFEAVFADFFDYGGRHYLVVGDRLSGWVEILSSSAGTDLGSSTGLIRHIRSFFATFGVPEEISSDGGPEFIAGNTEKFLRLWGVQHRLSSVGFPQSNGRAEVAVKTAKRLLMSNTGPTGSLDQDRFLRAILQLRNTPDPDCNLSPAQIIFGRPIRDALTFVNKLEKFSNPHVRPLWQHAWAAKEEALRTRISRTTESLKAHSRPLRPLALGEKVFLQNQRGNHPTKWDRSGSVVEAPGHDQYRVKVDGSGRLTLRNRRFLRAYTPATPCMQSTAAPLPPSSTDQRLCQLPQAAPRATPQLAVEAPPSANAEDLPPSPVTAHAAPEQDFARPVSSTTTPPAGTSTPSTPQQMSSPQRPPTLDQQSRPSRARRPPKHYEPETGTWIER